MDTAIPGNVRAKRKQKTFAGVLLLLVAAAGLVWLLRVWLSSSLQTSEFATAVVEKGDIENTLNATGEVIPEFEETVTSPITASIQQVLLDAGGAVKPGQAVLILDKSAAQTEYEKQVFQLESKRNSIRKLKLELSKSFFDLTSGNNIKQLRIGSLQAAVENARRLYKAGGGTREDVEQAELDLKVALLEKKQLENEVSSKQQTMQVDMRESEIAAEIQQSDLHALERKLRLANVVATRAGVVTWVNKNIGTAVHEGEALARIADLGSFRVVGAISDEYISRLHVGMPVIVRISETQLRGSVVNIYPAVQNSIVTFDVQLQERNSLLLRPNMKVEAYLVTDSRRNIMRVANGAAFKGASTQEVFVIEGGIAARRTVHIGLSNFDFVEIKDNVKPGERVIISDMSAYKDVKEVKIK